MMRKLSSTLLLFVAALTLVSGSARADDLQSYVLLRLIPELRTMLGKPNLDSLMKINNEEGFVMEKLSPQGALFYVRAGGKTPNQSFDELRQTSRLAVSIATCSGTRDMFGKISSATVWEGLDQVARLSAPIHLQNLIESINSSPQVSTPSNMRAPKTDNFRGIVFEYVKGDTTETVSFLDEMASQGQSGAEGDASPAKIGWQITNTSFCSR